MSSLFEAFDSKKRFDRNALSLCDQHALRVASWREIKPAGLAAALCRPVFNAR